MWHFPDPNTCFKMAFPNTHRRTGEHDVHSSHLQKRERKKESELNDSFLYPVMVAVSSFQSMIKSLTNKEFLSFWGKAASFLLGQQTTAAANLRGCSGQKGQFALP